MTTACARAPALGLRCHRAVGREGPWTLWGRVQVSWPALLLMGRGPRRQLTEAWWHVRGGSPSCPRGCRGGTLRHGLSALHVLNGKKTKMVSESQPLLSSVQLGVRACPAHLTVRLCIEASRAWRICGHPRAFLPAPPLPQPGLALLGRRAALGDTQPEQHQVGGEKGGLFSGH